MAFELEETLNDILKSLSKARVASTEEFPNIDLYMDQVTSFMDRQLKSMTRSGQDENILTKTMINNYAKNDLLPPPEKKKYNKDHMIVLMFIYYFKNVLAIKDIQTILNPITDKYFDEKNYSIEDIYNEILKHSETVFGDIENDVRKKYETAMSSFDDAAKVGTKDSKMLKDFAFLTMMTFDIYARKLMVQRIIDEIEKNE